MSEEIKGRNSIIRFEGILDWDELYSMFTGWFMTKKFDYYENLNVKKDTKYGYRREFSAKAEREETGYVKHIINITIIGDHMEDIDVNENGKKSKKTRIGMMTIGLQPSIELDYEDRWDKKFKKTARNFIHKHVLKGFIDEQMAKLTYETYKLHSAIKEVLKLEGS